MDHSNAHGHSTQPVQADSESVKRAQHMWDAFTQASLLAGGAVVVLLLLMAAFLV